MCIYIYTQREGDAHIFIYIYIYICFFSYDTLYLILMASCNSSRYTRIRQRLGLDQPWHWQHLLLLQFSRGTCVPKEPKPPILAQGLAFSATRFGRRTATKSHAKGVHSFLEPLPPVWSFPATVIHVLVLGRGCRNRDHGQHP